MQKKKKKKRKRKKKKKIFVKRKCIFAYSKARYLWFWSLIKERSKPSSVHRSSHLLKAFPVTSQIRTVYSQTAPQTNMSSTVLPFSGIRLSLLLTRVNYSSFPHKPWWSGIEQISLRTVHTVLDCTPSVSFSLAPLNFSLSFPFAFSLSSS